MLRIKKEKRKWGSANLLRDSKQKRRSASYNATNKPDFKDNEYSEESTTYSKLGSKN